MSDHTEEATIDELREEVLAYSRSMMEEERRANKAEMQRDALVSALEKAQQRLAALRAYVPVHMQTVYSCDMDDIDAAIRLTTGDQS